MIPDDKDNQILAEVSDYYSKKIDEHGLTPQGVDWNGAEGQTIRFQQLLKILPTSCAEFSINDIGCGYGALYDYLSVSKMQFCYFGIDVSPEMITAAKATRGKFKNAHFEVGHTPQVKSDFGVASGIFNVRQDRSDAEWLQYIKTTIGTLDVSSLKGFAFNCLTSYSDKNKMRPHLYYADPGYLFSYCKENFSKNVSLLHDYELYEFTILVRKQS